jgi:hypothetical protein
MNRLTCFPAGCRLTILAICALGSTGCEAFNVTWLPDSSGFCYTAGANPRSIARRLCIMI